MFGLNILVSAYLAGMLTCLLSVLVVGFIEKTSKGMRVQKLQSKNKCYNKRNRYLEIKDNRIL